MPANHWVMTGLLLLLGTPWALADDASLTGSPNLELLEFLGAWETADGEWIDPLDLTEMEPLAGQRGASETSAGRESHQGEFDVDRRENDHSTSYQETE